ncbi:MAG: hypothetical protein M1818_000607 [Claussenomyces sp. TS43310]|nr:MAG: hypothetical protein M1818_000607 [Claussenomyces sp. TS43310]
MPLTAKQTELIKATVPVLQEHGNIIAATFYGNMIRENPELNNVFNKTNQANQHQPRALAGSLLAYAANIDNLSVLGPAIERISQKHVSFFIRPEDYKIVEKYLLAAMGQVLGPALTPEVLEAWTVAYNQLADIMINREAVLYKEDEGWTDWRDFKIKRKVVESDEITSFYLQPVDEKPLPGFKPGQYISIRNEVPEWKHLQVRQYSLSDAPREDYYRISVRRDEGITSAAQGSTVHPGYISNVLHKTKQEGDTIQVSHPHGEFFLDTEKLPSSTPVVLISAGVGLTPLLSILNTLVAKGSQQPISWVHGVRRSSAQAFGPHVRDICKSHQNVHSTIFNANPLDQDVLDVDYHHSGRVQLPKLRPEEDLFLGDKSTQYYICGPAGFMVAMEKSLLSSGVDQARINLELFGTGDLPGRA